MKRNKNWEVHQCVLFWDISHSFPFTVSEYNENVKQGSAQSCKSKSK